MLSAAAFNMQMQSLDAWLLNSLSLENCPAVGPRMDRSSGTQYGTWFLSCLGCDFGILIVFALGCLAANMTPSTHVLVFEGGFLCPFICRCNPLMHGSLIL